MKYLFIILLAVAVVIGGPLATLWALNTLFPALAIPYTIDTWFAAFIVQAVLKANVSVNK